MYIHIGSRAFLAAPRCQNKVSKHSQVARLLAEIDADGIYVRGVFVDDASRGKGYSRLMLTTFAALCFKCFGEGYRYEF